MKKKNLSLLFVILSQTIIWGQSAIIDVNTDESQILWVGKKVTGQHDGTIKMISGSIEMEDQKIVGGSFEVDMTSIICTDLSGEYKTKLEKHLKSSDFLE